MSHLQRVLAVFLFLFGSASGAGPAEASLAPPAAQPGGSLERAPEGLPTGVDAAAAGNAMPSGPGAEPYYAQPGLPKGVDPADPVVDGQPQAGTPSQLVETAAVADAAHPDLVALNAAAKALQPKSAAAAQQAPPPSPPISETPGSIAYLAPAGLPKGVDP